MPDQQPVMSHEEPLEAQDDWLQESEELPRRPRRRLLGAGARAGGNPILFALLGVLLAACGFIGGVLIEKGETSSSSSTGSAAASLASRFRALRGGTGTGTSSTSTGGSSSSAAGFARPTAGTVAYLAGSTLYVTNAEGNTIKVTTSAGTSVTKTVKASVKGIHPGETVTITGATGSNGAVSAESISVGSSGGGLAALFGGSSAGTGASRSGAGSSSGGEPSLFGGG
ncbi:MAG: hypothetical protein ABSB69_18620 [Solirubrobacteraceae bacterium]